MTAALKQQAIPLDQILNLGDAVDVSNLNRNAGSAANSETDANPGRAGGTQNEDYQERSVRLG